MEPKELKIIAAATALIHRHGFRKVTMSDIADAASMSRPSLYASFPNKEAVFSAIAQQHCEHNERVTKQQLPSASTLEQRLSRIIGIWIIEPFASVIDAPNGLDLLANASSYAPAAIDDVYTRFENHLTAALKPEMPRRRGMSARDLAHIMMLATKGLKASTATLAELQRMTDGLIIMAVATAQSGSKPRS